MIEEENSALFEKSLFRTRVPRSTNMTLHVIVCVITLCCSLLVAVLSAQNFWQNERFLANSIASEQSKPQKSAFEMEH